MKVLQLILIILILFLLYYCKGIISDEEINKSPCSPNLLDPVYPAPYGSPSWHPDGKIAFNWTKILKIDRCTGSVAESDIDQDSSGFWIINEDGSGLQKLLPYGLDSPVWSPDGEWIAFGAGQIFKMRFTGTNFDTNSVTQLTFEGRNFYPSWSPDGEWIVYDSNLESPNGMNFIWIMKSDGSQKKRIAYEPTQGEIRTPFWSSNGTKIVHIRYLLGVFSSEIFVMDTTGENPERLTFNKATDYQPQFSPYGTTIAFWSQTQESGQQLWTMDSNGSSLHPVTTEGADLTFSWSPDGTHIVYVYYNFRKADVKNGTLWIINTDSNNKRQLTFNRDLIFIP